MEEIDIKENKQKLKEYQKNYVMMINNHSLLIIICYILI